MMNAMQAIDIQNVDKNSLVDLNTVHIDSTRPVAERVSAFVEQIKNPYCYKVGDIAVKVVYKNGGPTFQQSLVDFIKTV